MNAGTTTGTMTRGMTGTAPSASSRRWWIAVGSVLTVATLVWGSFQMIEVVAREQREVVTRIDEVISVIDVTASHGSIRIVATTDDHTVLTERISEGLRSVSVAHEVVDGRLVASSSCPNFSGPWCSVSYVIEAPEGVDVLVRTRHGDVRVLGPVGTVDLRTQHGDVNVAGASGDLVVVSRHGDIDLAPNEPPASVLADTRHGDIELVLPDSEVAYRVDLRTRHGNTLNALRSDPTGTRSIVLTTRHGDVTARYAP